MYASRTNSISTKAHAFRKLVVALNASVASILLLGGCLSLQTGLTIQRATTPQHMAGIKLVLGEQEHLGERRRALGASDTDGPVERFVALDTKNNDLVVGCVYCQTKRPNPAPSVAHFLSPYVHLYNLHVAPNMRRQGLGTALVQRVIEECLDNDWDDDNDVGGCQGVLLSVDANNAGNAVRIYEKMGFSVSGVKCEGETPMFRPKDPPS